MKELFPIATYFLGLVIGMLWSPQKNGRIKDLEAAVRGIKIHFMPQTEGQRKWWNENVAVLFKEKK